MRLLKSLAGRGLEFTKDLDEDDIPRYAILSHTWGADEEEVSFKDLVDGTSKHKTGYNKLMFCEEQARRDELQHFWVDTCCIDKSNGVELNTAITSMFRWYAKASKCYVYLADVSSTPSSTGSGNTATWRSEFRSCRWLTRGWTLQELLAPEVVEFYDKTGQKLGDKKTLEHHICDITGIPAAALRGRDLSSFSIEERFSWQRNRKTRKPEDEAYSLSGICGVSMIPIYGEGRDKALARLCREVDDVLKGAKRVDFSLPFEDTPVVGVEKFVAREKELEEIHSALNGDGRRRTVTLHGLGGIGKTQLAIAYVRWHKNSYSAVFWLNIRDETSVKQSFCAIARRILRYHPFALYLSDIDLAGNLDEISEAVMAWLSISDNTRWLAIYDNYDNPRIPGNTDPAAVDVRKFLPAAYQGSVIVTTRSYQVRIGRAIAVRKLTSVQESVDILSSMSRRALSADDPNVVALVQRLDGLPLALATTGSYLDQVTVSIAEYLGLYESSWLQLHENDPGLEAYEDRTLYSTWRVSLDRIQQQNELSAKVLGLWCYFGNQDLWFELVRDGPTKELSWLCDLTAGFPVFTAAMRLLCNYGLVEGDTASRDTAESRGYSIHACVHSWTIHVLNKQWDNTLANFAVCAIGQHVPSQGATEPWAIQRRLLQHAERCSLYLLEIDSAQADLLGSLHNLGVLYSDQGKMNKAEEMYLRALRGFEQAWGPTHTSTLGTVSNLGILYRNQGKMNKAEEMYLRALRGKEEAWGPTHTSTLGTVNNLGNLYSNQGKMNEAEEMYLRALRGFEEAWGPTHTSTLDTVNNLGILYLNQGKINEAEEMYIRALRGKEEAWGPTHTSTLDTINNLGILYRNQGKINKAEEMYLRALRGKEEVWGPTHTSTLDTINNLGNLYLNQGKINEAEEMYLRALRGKEKAWGPDHTSTLDTVHNLGSLYADLGKMEEAEAMYLRALRGYEKARGAKHPTTLLIGQNLAELQEIQVQEVQAEQGSQKVSTQSSQSRTNSVGKSVTTLHSPETEKNSPSSLRKVRQWFKASRA